MRYLVLSLGVFLFLVGAASSSKLPNEEIRDFGWWRVVCEGEQGQRKCAIGTELYSMRAGLRPTLVLDPTVGWTVLERDAVAVHLVVDKKEQFKTQRCETAAVGASGCLFGAEASQRITWLLRRGRDLEVRVEYRNGIQVTVIPLEEFEAAWTHKAQSEKVQKAH